MKTFSCRAVIEEKDGRFILRDVSANREGITGLGLPRSVIKKVPPELLTYARTEAELYSAEPLRISGECDEVDCIGRPTARYVKVKSFESLLK